MDEMFVFLGFVVIIVAVIYAPQLIVSALGKKKLFFTSPQEATAEAVVSGEELHQMVMSFQGHEFIGERPNWREEWINNRKSLTIENQVPKGTQSLDLNLSEKESEVQSGDKKEPEEIDRWLVVPKKDQESRSGIFGKVFAGFRFYGLPPIRKIYTYNFSWIGVTTGNEKGDDDFRFHKDEPLQSILLKETVYGLSLKNVELAGNFQADFWLTARIIVRNPARALFRVHRWLDASWKLIVSEFRDEVRKMKYEEIAGRTKQEGSENSDNKSKLMILNQKTQLILLDAYGVEVIELLIYSIDPAASQKVLTDAVVANEVARLQGLAKKTAANADAEALRAYDAAAKEVSSNTLHLKGLETLGKTQSNIIVSSKEVPVLLNMAPSSGAKSA